jgi:hypothetical protein
MLALRSDAWLALVLPTVLALASCSDSDTPPSAPPAANELEPTLGQGEPVAGRFRPAPITVPTSPEMRAHFDELEAIGYSGASENDGEARSVTVHDTARAQPGLNFYSSGHGPEAVLMDMDGNVRHRWRAAAEDLWPDEELSANQRALVQFWRRAFLLPNGDVLAIFEGHSLVKLDKDSRVLWKSRCRAHHDLELLPSGEIVVLTRRAVIRPEIDPAKPVLEDRVSLLDANGIELRSFSLLEALEASPHAELARRAKSGHADPLHTNSLALLDGRLAERLPAFRAGNLLLSSRTLSFLSVVDPNTQRVEWVLQGAFKTQHDPKVLANGNLLVFDNSGRGEASSVLELDPLTGATLWEYRGTPEHPFFSRTCGTAERLANGNTLITESDGGRAFEVTHAGEIVWEFYNPERTMLGGKEYIATLFEVVRLAPEFPVEWLE